MQSARSTRYALGASIATLSAVLMVACQGDSLTSPRAPGTMRTNEGYGVPPILAPVVITGVNTPPPPLPIPPPPPSYTPLPPPAYTPPPPSGDPCLYGQCGGAFPGTGSNSYDTGKTADAAACLPATDARCKLKRPSSSQKIAMNNEANRLFAMGGECAQVGLAIADAVSNSQVFFFDGPLPGAGGGSSTVGDFHPADGPTGFPHVQAGEVHISLIGFDGKPNTIAQQMQILRHEAKHRVGWSHDDMDRPTRSCNP